VTIASSSSLRVRQTRSRISSVLKLSTKGVEFSRPISDERFGLITAMKMPGGGELALYEPKHPSPLAQTVDRDARVSGVLERTAVAVEVDRPIEIADRKGHLVQAPSQSRDGSVPAGLGPAER